MSFGRGREGRSERQEEGEAGQAGSLAPGRGGGGAAVPPRGAPRAQRSPPGFALSPARSQVAPVPGRTVTSIRPTSLG